VAKLTEHNDPVHKVTIIPRGLPWADPDATQGRPAELEPPVGPGPHRHVDGRAHREELEFNEITSGAKSDIEHATKFARSMVCEWA